jgi:hypothetical protein
VLYTVPETIRDSPAPATKAVGIVNPEATSLLDGATDRSTVLSSPSPSHQILLPVSGEWREVITLESKKEEVEPEAAADEPSETYVKASVENKAQETKTTTVQTSFTDFGLYQCKACGKLVMGYEKGNHQREKHGEKGVEWKKVR